MVYAYKRINLAMINTKAGREDRAAPDVVMPEMDAARLQRQAQAATRFLKALANQHRLMILCHLVEGERAVGELEEELGIQQAHLSQHLARLRHDGLVRTRRESRAIYYRLGSDEARAVLGTLYRLFCRTSSQRGST